MRKIVFAFILSSAFMGHSENNEIDYTNVQYGEESGHEYVDLGLPSGTLWAACNLGSNSPNESGLCFSWGENEPRESFVFDNYSFFEREETDESGETLYILTDIGEDITGTQYDAAKYLWGGGWRMPNQEDCNELLTYCSTEYNDGLRIQGPNGNSIFLPLTFCQNNHVSQAVLIGSYWTGDLDTANSKNNSAMSLFFSNSKLQYKSCFRYYGMSIRPVISKKDVGTSVDAIKKSNMSIHYDNGVFYVDDRVDDCVAIVSDISGRIISKSWIKDQKFQINALTQGIYILSLHRDDSAILIQKIIVW
ncbi:MAG: hypothetical protein K2L22_04375 [Muribaculaceae bacterium]|nr:hypothetical protein [Muribaculaceae bacterium]